MLQGDEVDAMSAGMVAAPPQCPACRSTHTAAVSTGIADRVAALAASKRNVKVLRNPFGDEAFYCCDCETFFDEVCESSARR